MLNFDEWLMFKSWFHKINTLLLKSILKQTIYKSIWLYYIRGTTQALCTATILYHKSLYCFKYPKKTWNRKFNPKISFAHLHHFISRVPHPLQGKKECLITQTIPNCNMFIFFITNYKKTSYRT